MFVIRNKRTKEILFIDHTSVGAPEIRPEEVYPSFDPETMEIGSTDKTYIPAHFDIDENGEIVEMGLAEQIEAGVPILTPTQKLVDGKIAEKSTDELIEEKLVDPSMIKQLAIERLRVEVAAYFQQQRTPNGYRIDDMARQKASLSSQMRSLPDSDDNKRRLLDAGQIYPDPILDEILDEVGKVQAAYGAAKRAIVTACDAGEPA
ncbi:MAG: hypothetical protein GY835_05170, partial [bacterium]|nr:hypothetical protein [bacterium]